MLLRNWLARLARGRVAPGHAPTEHDRNAMDRALTLARQAAAEGEVPVGAVVYALSDGRVVAEAHNRRERDKDPSAHAEHIAITQACRVLGDWRLSDCAVAVTLEPCPMCAGLIVNARDRRGVYGGAEPKAGAVDTLYRLLTDARLNHRARWSAALPPRRPASCSQVFFARCGRAGASPTGMPGRRGGDPDHAAAESDPAFALNRSCQRSGLTLLGLVAGSFQSSALARRSSLGIVLR